MEKSLSKPLLRNGNSQVNVSGTLQANRGTLDIRHSRSSGQMNPTNADIHADTFKVATLGSNGVLRVGGGSLSADTTLQLYATSGNGQVVFVGNVNLNGNSTKSIAGNSVTITTGCWSTSRARKHQSTSIASVRFRTRTTLALAETATPPAPLAARAPILRNPSRTHRRSVFLRAVRRPLATSQRSAFGHTGGARLRRAGKGCASQHASCPVHRELIDGEKA